MIDNFHIIRERWPSERATRTALEPVSLFGLGDDAIRAALQSLPVFGAMVPDGWRRGEVITLADRNAVAVIGQLARTKPGAGFALVSDGTVAIYYPVELPGGNRE